MPISVKGVGGWLLDSPFARAVGFGVATIGSNILTGCLVHDITVEGTITWALAPQSRYFWILFGLVVCAYFYFRAVFDASQKKDNFGDPEFCKEYVRRECLPAAADHWRKEIANGNVAALDEALRKVEEHIK